MGDKTQVLIGVSLFSVNWQFFRAVRFPADQCIQEGNGSITLFLVGKLDVTSLIYSVQVIFKGYLIVLGINNILP